MMDLHIYCFLVSIVTVFGQQRFVKEPQNVTVPYGSQAKLACHVTGLMGQVQWTKDDFGLGTDRQLVSFDRYTMMNNPEYGNYGLLISNTQLDDDGVYQCQISATQGSPGMRSQKAYVVVLLSPEKPLIQEGPEVTLNSGEPANLTCVARNGRPAAAIKWLTGGEEIVTNLTYYSTEMNEDGKREHATSILTITPNKADQDRIITCQASNPVNEKIPFKTADVKININYKPEVTMTVSPSRSAKEGQDIFFSCGSRANPPQVEWRWYVNKKIQGGETRSTFIRKNIVRSMHGDEISCEAVNSIGSGTQKYMLNVEYGPAFDGPAVHAEADLGKDVTLTCQVKGNPKPTILWRKKNSNRILGSESMLKLSGVGNRDFGPYICQATVLGFPEIYREIYLVRKGPPSILSPTEQSGIFGQIGHVTCEMQSVPKPDKVIWKKDGKPVDFATEERYTLERTNLPNGIISFIKIRNLQTADYGNYSCSIDNGYGKDSLMITYVPRAVVPLAFILGGVIGGVVLLIIIIIIVFVCQRKKSTSYADSDTASTSTGTPKKKEGTPDIKMEYSEDTYDSSAENWKANYEKGQYSRYSPEYDQLSYGTKVPNGYGTDYPIGQYDRSYPTDPYGTYPGPPMNYDRYDESYSNTLPPGGYDMYRPPSRPASRQDYAGSNYGGTAQPASRYATNV